MTHRFRYWRSYPETPTPVERRKASRVVATCLSVAVLGCVVAIAILFAFVLDLRNARLHETARRQAAINATFCNVLAQLPPGAPALERIRADLHCPPPTGA